MIENHFVWNSLVYRSIWLLNSQCTLNRCLASMQLGIERCLIAKSPMCCTFFNSVLTLIPPNSDLTYSMLAEQPLKEFLPVKYLFWVLPAFVKYLMFLSINQYQWFNELNVPLSVIRVWDHTNFTHGNIFHYWLLNVLFLLGWVLDHNSNLILWFGKPVHVFIFSSIIMN